MFVVALSPWIVTCNRDTRHTYSGFTDAPVAAVAAPIAGVRELTLSGTALTIRVDGGARLLPNVITAIHDSGFTITDASMTRISLEDVFIAITGRSLRDAQIVAAEARRASMPRRYA